MSHVDDGILHACLDGALEALADAGELPPGMTAADVVAHIQSCDDCSSRLRIEREMRESAGAVLRDAVPARTDIPPLQAIPQRHVPARRTNWLPLAWAASLVMALGAGWWASRVSFPQPQLATSQQALDPARDNTDPAASEAANQSATTAPGSQQARRDEPQQRASAAGIEQASVPQARAPQASAQQASAQQASAQQASAQQASAQQASVPQARRQEVPQQQASASQPELTNVAAAPQAGVTDAQSGLPADASSPGALDAQPAQTAIRMDAPPALAMDAQSAGGQAARAAAEAPVVARAGPGRGETRAFDGVSQPLGARTRPAANVTEPAPAPAAQVAGAVAPDSSLTEPLRLNAERTVTFRFDSAAQPFQRRIGLNQLESMAGKPLALTAHNGFHDGATLQFIDLRGQMAFDSILVRERSGSLSFGRTDVHGKAGAAARALVPNDSAARTLRMKQTAAGAPVPVLRDAFAPAVELAHDAGRTIVRVTQTLLTGEVVQIVSWHTVPDGGEPPVSMRTGSVRSLEDGRRELVFRTAAGWIAIRGDLTAAELTALVPGLTFR